MLSEDELIENEWQTGCYHRSPPHLRLLASANSTQLYVWMTDPELGDRWAIVDVSEPSAPLVVARPVPARRARVRKHAGCQDLPRTRR